MKETIDARGQLYPKALSVPEIRLRVEEIAEELAMKLRPEQRGETVDGLEAFPLDNRKFIVLMSEYIRLN
ncbi:MAG TPA: hypothetical protein VFP98_03135 [Candidatus Polarisedimenticolia bacterium]|nr:hypothetical protein [Candidatus Polarisedimenticolia bacterium]